MFLVKVSSAFNLEFTEIFKKNHIMILELYTLEQIDTQIKIILIKLARTSFTSCSFNLALLFNKITYSIF